jgi:hypothetical protein
MLRRIMLLVGLAGLVVPATAEAARPAARTGGAVNLTQTTATIRGLVDANRASTTYYFQVGRTKAYGSSTPVTAAGRRARAIGVSADLSGLAPGATYHYRLIAENKDGIARGRDRTFKATPQPLAIAITAIPNPVRPGRAVTVAGQLSGTGHSGRQVILQSNPYPYTQGFVTVGNALVTDAAGNFSFSILSLPVTTQFRVMMARRPEIASGILTVDAAVHVRAAARKVVRRRSSVTVRFRGSVLPARDGGRVDIQKLRGGQWVTVAHTRAQNATKGRSRYAIRVRVFRSGRYRVVAQSAGDFSSGASRTIAIKVRR